MTEEKKVNRGGPKRILPEVGSPGWEVLCQRYRDGEPLSGLAEELGVQPGSIRTSMSQHGITRAEAGFKAHRLLPDVGTPEWDELCKRYRDGEHIEVLASAYKVSPRTISNNMALYGVTRGGMTMLELDQIVDDGLGLTRLESEVLKLVRERAVSVGEISRRVNFPYGVSSETVIKTVDALRAKHYEVILDETRHEVSIPHELKADFEPTDFQYFRRHYTIGLVSDTHLCSRCQQLTLLHDAYKILDDRKTDFNVHCGDLVDGRDIYRGHRDEVFLHSAEEQRDYAVEKYPKSSRKTKTWVIGGQHDYSFHKLTGYNILEHICTERKDLVYKGFFKGEFRVKGVPIEIQHPGGGQSYAKSYRIQKIIEGMIGFLVPTKGVIPKLVVFGHWHTPILIPSYMGVDAMSLPCFQTQTPFLKQRGLMPTIGFAIAEIWLDKEGSLSSLKVEFINQNSQIRQADY